MKKRIPLHSLVFCPLTDQFNGFAAHEKLSNRLIERDLVGDDSRIELSAIVFEELCHRVRLKLSLGERVVVFSGDLSVPAKAKLTAIASDQGASVIETDTGPLPDITRNDLSFPSKWQGITVAGDIHGDLRALTDAMAWAKSRNHFIWFLGDIVDCGQDTLQTMSTVYHAVMAGEAGMTIGNHERKIARWLDQNEQGRRAQFHISDGNKVTIAALNRLDSNERRQWIGQFRSLLAHSSLMFQTANVTLLHAAAHPSLWSDSPSDKDIERFALYGETETGVNYNRSYRWTDAVPKGQMVIVGHDIVHDFPIVKSGRKGGQVVFLDTGCGKGGHLSSADLKFTHDGRLQLECFKQY